MTLRRYWLVEEPRGDLYRELIRAGLKQGGSFMLVVQPQLSLGERGTDVLRKLKEIEHATSQVNEWPGTTLWNAQVVTLYQWPMSEETAAVLIDSAEGLYEWAQPELPEDLAIVRQDGDHWLTSIAHEAESFLSLTPDEARAIEEALPSIRLEPDEAEG